MEERVRVYWAYLSVHEWQAGRPCAASEAREISCFIFGAPSWFDDDGNAYAL